MSPETGEIIAYVNNPSIDLYKISEDYLFYNDSLKTPYLNRGINPYEPGSIMKIPVAMMLLEEGFNPNTTYICDGAYEFSSPNQKPKRCWKEDGHGEIDLKDAIKFSCNISIIDDRDIIRDKFETSIDKLIVLNPLRKDELIKSVERLLINKDSMQDEIFTKIGLKKMKTNLVFK